ncbi:MAG: hypothetical protein IKX62_06610 [Bacteroidales bacterium]|nr:hypothetical protein [Bacteroidales bacterium]
MKKNCFTSAAPVAVAMLLLFAVTACTKDKTPEPSEAGGCYVTVSAGLPTTKTAADHNESNGVYTLKFTEGDRLYVHGTQEDANEGGTLHLAGYLGMVSGSISEDGKQATFSGSLNYYKEVTVDGTVWYQATDRIIPDNPLLACETTVVRLIPQGAGTYLHEATVLNNNLTDLDVYVKDAVVQAEDNGNPLPLLMSSAVDVRGTYDKDKKCIILNQSEDVIFDVTLPESINTSYSVALQLWDISDPSTKLAEYSLEGSVSTTRFVVSVGIVGKAGHARLFMREQQVEYPSEKCIILGSSQCFERKIYNWHI